MKALSIQQPWAYCITDGTKRVENRTWVGRHRGALLIHAGKTYQAGLEMAIHRDSPEVDLFGMVRAPRGAIVGVCRMIDCIAPPPCRNCGHSFESHYLAKTRALCPAYHAGEEAVVPKDQRIWADVEQYKFHVADVHAFATPIPFKGALGFFEVPINVVAAAILACGFQLA